MVLKKSLNFYKNIPKSKLPLTELLKNETLFYNVPKSWSIVVTDIENSTEAVNRGAHNDVNLSATGSIVTVLNTLKALNQKNKIPYFFGGDGSTFIIPNAVLEPVLEALNNFSEHIKKTVELNLRVGHLGVEQVYANNVSLRISKVRHNKYFTTPVVLGNGLKYAEHLIKENFKVSDINSTENTTPNLEGMECRWDEIYPNETDKKVICLLVDCDDESKQAEVYGAIMNEIELIFGNLEKRNPISTLKLKLNTSLAKIRKEMLMKLGKHQITYLISNWVVTHIGKYYFQFFKSGKLYKHRITQLSDTIMLDGFLNTVITGTDEQVDKLKILLDDLELRKEIIYGMHITHASIMSCYIEDREEKHVHFVDGTEGGYTSAAIMFKDKLKKLEFRNT
ncbi:Protein of unknown function (DUF3095) [Aequorivita sublithincola DSM 14238]|uniref:DUF3095 domain-containing protein n=1 Tax=Aequorivita sublithincola (strain DSM 14238 / LMG 21431 / ACAM 643 / 9-3) TaxID=746697 RepID=I3YRJ7_AEQSU|nr:Protein of unknown function (DUF3095) [Aequorivita sublithincola DSM 14238]